jgi:hypothetical protein
MGDKISTEDLTGRRTQPTTDDVMRDDDADGAPMRSPLTEANRAGDAPRAATDVAAETTGNEPLLGAEDGARFERQWHQVQLAFVDEPREAVEKADHLVAELMRHLAETFADERNRLETAWSAGEDVDTENLRVALTRYRSFFQRLLAT